MGIKDYRPETAIVSIGNTTLTLRGVGLEDISVLVRDHLDDLDGLMAIFNKSVKTDMEVAMMTQYIVALIREAPAVVSMLICLADMESTGNPEDYRPLGLPQQLKCVEAIGGLTFKEAGGPKKLLESLSGLILNASPVAQKQTGSRPSVRQK